MASRISFRKGHEGKKKASVSNSMGISLEELYCKLESDYRISKGRNLYFDFFEAKNDSEKVHFNYERELLLSYKDHFKSFLSTNDKAKLAEYCSKRLLIAENIHLLCIYSFSMFHLSKDKKYLFDAISYSEKILQELYLIGEKDNGFEFGELFDFLYPLCKQYNKADKLITIVNEAIINSDSCFHFYILVILNNFIEKQKPVINIKKDFNQESLVKLCLQDYDSETDSRKQERLLDFALNFSKHISNSVLRKKVCETKGDYLISHLTPNDDRNIIIRHYNNSKLVNAIGLYKEAKNEEKRKYAILQYEENKSKLQYIKFTHSISKEEYEKRTLVRKEAIDSISKEGHFQILRALCGFGIDWFCLDADRLYQAVQNQIKEFVYTQFTYAVKSDSYNNKRQCTHEEIILHQLFNFQFRQYAFYIFTQVLAITMKNNTFSFDTLKEDLCRMGFNCFVVHKEHNGERILTTPFNMVENGLHEFLVQHQKFVNGEKTDWRFCISFLSTQFEGIMRIIVKSLEEPIVKERDGDREFITLESLLKTKALKSIFTKEDLLLFSQTYTKVGYNIRNDVAHGLLLPQEYTASKALLVFVSILRLAKGIFNYIHNQQCDNIQDDF